MTENRYAAIVSLLLFGCVISSALPALGGTGGGYRMYENTRPSSDNKANIMPNLSVGVSSLARVVDGQIHERQIEISWWSIDGGYQEGDQIILYQYVSETSFCQATGSAVIEQTTIDVEMANASWVRFNSSMPHWVAGDLINERCQYYWAAYVRQNGQIVACNCLRARPNWMADLKDRINVAKLRELYLPGTHDAAAYERYAGLSSDNLNTKYAITQAKINSKIQKLTDTQDEDLFHQLSFGVRYLDMRIIFSPNLPNSDVRFFTHHGSYILRPLVNDTALVREFISRTDEIVIFDIHGVDNLDQEPGAHQELQDLLYQEFGQWMAPANMTWEATLSDFWSSGKRLIVTYNDPNQIGAPYFWSAVRHQWGNVNTVEDLEFYLSGVMENAAQGQLEFAWSAMSELTPNSVDVMTDRLDGLRNAADLVNRNVTNWFRDRWSELATIVSLDFFLGGNIIDLAIAENQQECWTTPLYSSERPRVFLTLSPLAKSMSGGNIQQRQIELNWHGNRASSQSGDWIGLYEHDPINNPTLPVRQITVATGRNNGYYKTDVQFGFPAVDRQLFAGDSCLGYWIGYIRNGVTISSNCLKIRPVWMWQNRETLGSVPLYQLFLPGTHNSGSYRPYNGHSSDTVFMRYLICQDEDIFHSLAYGIRYLDVRVGYYPEREEKFWLNHNYARVNPLRFLIEDLKNFLEVTREIVILDFHRFPVGFSQNTQRNRETHAQLVQLLLDKLGDFMVQSSFGPMATMNDLWAINRTLIVVYADDWTRSSHPFLWPSIPQEWGDKRNAEDLYRYLSGIDHKRFDYDYFWAAMAELTPSTMDVLFRPNDGLRKLADNVARNVTTWYRDLWWKTTSIAAVDFFHSTDIIDVAIDASLKRVRCSRATPTTLSSAPTIQQTIAEERSTATDRRRFYLGPRNLDFAESTSETTPSLDTTSLSPRMAARRRRPKNTTIVMPPNLPVTTTTTFN